MPLVPTFIAYGHSTGSWTGAVTVTYTAKGQAQTAALMAASLAIGEDSIRAKAVRKGSLSPFQGTEAGGTRGPLTLLEGQRNLVFCQCPSQSQEESPRKPQLRKGSCWDSILEPGTPPWMVSSAKRGEDGSLPRAHTALILAGFPTHLRDVL